MTYASQEAQVFRLLLRAATVSDTIRRDKCYHREKRVEAPTQIIRDSNRKKFAKEQYAVYAEVLRVRFASVDHPSHSCFIDGSDRARATGGKTTGIERYNFSCTSKYSDYTKTAGRR